MTYRHPDATAMAELQSLLDGADHAALAFDMGGAPMVSRIALQRIDGALMSLVSDLAAHGTALRLEPACALLIAAPAFRGDPMTHVRLSVRAVAEYVDPAETMRRALKSSWVARQPKSKLYVDFADFHFVRFRPRDGLLNAGFGRAYRLTADDLGMNGPAR